jgi:dTDP-4-amino-4,6-dideoxygalactose transaminase
MSDTIIPLVDLKAQWAEIADECEPLVLDRLRSGDYLGHETIAAFEREWAEYVGGGVHAVACSSGTDAVELAVRICTPEGAEVGVDEMGFVATTAAVERAGRRVVPNHERVTGDGYTIATWLYGSTVYADELARQCRERGDVLIEDASQAHGSPKAGRVGAAAAFSLYPSKNLGGVTQGGVVTFRDPIAAARARRVREHGYDRKSDQHFERGWNMRMSAFNADVLRVKLKRLDGWIARRREIAATYCSGLTNVSGLMLPDLEPDHVWHIFSVRVSRDRDRVINRLRERGVSAAVHYRTDAFGRESRWTRENMSLPMFPQMTDSQVERVINAVKAVLA